MKRATSSLLITFAFWILMFLAMLVFFCRLHPIMILDTDDWWYMGHYRIPIPLWGYQNPIKAFPEYFLPLTDYFAGHFLTPITGNLFTAISLMDGVIMSVLVTLYFFCFYRLMRKLADSHGRLIPITLTLLFAVFHFSFLIRQNAGNAYLFLAVDQTTYFHYMIPGLMNAILVLCLMKRDILTDFFSKPDILWKILFLPFAYFSIFSNVFCCVISAVWVGCSLLSDIFRHLRAEGILLFLRRRLMKIFFLLTWLTAQIFEMNGNRAVELTAKNNFSSAFSGALQNFCHVLSSANRPALAILFLTVVLFFAFLLMHKINTDRETVFFCLPAVWAACFLTLIYIALICAKAGSWYITRPDANFGIFFYLFTACMIMASQLIKSSRKLVFAFLTAFGILLCVTLLSDFRESNQGGYDAEACLRVDNDILRQFSDVYDAGGNSLILYVPKYESEDNWPLAAYSNGEYYSFAFLNTGVMNRYFYVEVIPSEEKNRELGLN